MDYICNLNFSQPSHPMKSPLFLPSIAFALTALLLSNPALNADEKEKERRPAPPQSERGEREMERDGEPRREGPERGRPREPEPVRESSDRERSERAEPRREGKRSHDSLPRPEEVERRIHHLHAAAENLEQAGLHDEAGAFHERAEHLERELHEAMERRHGRPPHPGGEELEQLRREVAELRELVHDLRRHVQELEKALDRRNGADHDRSPNR